MTKEAQLTAIDDEIKQLIEELETLDTREEEVQSPKSGIEQVEKNLNLRFDSALKFNFVYTFR